MSEPTEAESEGDVADEEAFFTGFDVVVDVQVGLQHTKRLAQPDLADDVEREVLDFARHVDLDDLFASRDIFCADEVHELLNTAIDRLFKIEILAARVLQVRIDVSQATKRVN